ncbi:hypothetical protein AB0I77_10100 [Streptomyces sp. NPDC050619]|uniref:hypothetical protein n=1 Tax=Streptomyces sp. NPDC050619 TaxID=3157214 RepID=UPI003426BD66
MTLAAVPWTDVEKILRQRCVTDVLVAGYIERDGGLPQFKPAPVVVFVLLNGGKEALRLEADDQEAQLAVSIVENVTLKGVRLFDLFEEETGDEPALASLSDQLLGDGWTQLRCTATRAFTDARSSPESGVLKSLALELDSRHWLFFDPTWVFGIRIGKAEDLHSWERDYGGEGMAEQPEAAR